jgi:hypothetical protein
MSGERQADNVTPFQSRAEQEQNRLEDEDRIEREFLAHSAIFVPINALSNAPLTSQERELRTAFIGDAPTLTLLINVHASRDEVLTQLRRVLAWIEENDISAIQSDSRIQTLERIK